MSHIQLKRIYEGVEQSDGKRILVDRIWPRGVTKEEARLTVWMKEIAPSHPLRQFFGHIPERFEAFKALYIAELDADSVQPFLQKLRKCAERDTITLLYAAKDKQYNHAVILKEYLDQLNAKNPLGEVL